MIGRFVRGTGILLSLWLALLPLTPVTADSTTKAENTPDVL